MLQTFEERRALVHASDLEWSPTVSVLDEFDQFDRDITSQVTGIRVKHDSFDQIHGQLDMTTWAEADWGRERIKVEVTLGSEFLGVSDTIPVGVFCCTVPTPTRTIPVTLQVTGFDKLYLLSHGLDRAYSLRAGDPILGHVRAILEDKTNAPLGVDAISSARGLDVMLSTRTWILGEGTTWLNVINDLLGMVGYGGLYMTGGGLFKSEPYVEPERRDIVWRYWSGELDNIIDADVEGSIDNDFTDQYNAWTFEQNNGTERESPATPGDGQYVFQNTSDGPGSIRERGGLIIPRPLEMLDALTQADLEAQAKRIIAEDIRSDELASFGTFLNPYHGHLDIMDIRETLLGTVGRKEHITWEMDLDVGKMNHHIRATLLGVIT